MKTPADEVQRGWERQQRELEPLRRGIVAETMRSCQFYDQQWAMMQRMKVPSR